MAEDGTKDDAPSRTSRSGRGAKSVGTPPRPKELVLDGQQRLTALMYALTAPDYSLKETTKPRRFFIDLQKALEDIDDDEIVVDVVTADLGELATHEGQFKRLLLPCTALLEDSSFSNWKDKLDDHLRATDMEKHKQYREKWREPWTKLVDIDLLCLAVSPQREAHTSECAAAGIADLLTPTCDDICD